MRRGKWKITITMKRLLRILLILALATVFGIIDLYLINLSCYLAAGLVFERMINKE